jgi:hypothetical protein
MARPMRRALVGALTAAAACCLSPAVAQAVTIGVPNLNPTTAGGIGCSPLSGTCSLAQTTPAVAAPFDGILTRWRIRVLSPGGAGTAQLRILRPQSGAFLWSSSGGAEGVIPPNDGAEPVVHVFERHTPVVRGDQIGVTISNSVVLTQGAAEGYAGASTSIWNPPAADGTSPPPTGSIADTALGLNADIERDADGDMLGDETQDSDDDNDGTPDSADNCPATAGASQADTDADGAGDLCDADDDNDGLSDAAEAALGSNPASADSDGDGATDGTDRCLLIAGPGGCPGAAVLVVKAPTRMKRRAFTAGVRVTITPDQAVALRLSLVAPGRGRGTILAEKSLPVAAGARTVRLKPSRKAAKGVRRVQLRVLAINATGTQTERRKSLRITR